MMRIGGLLGFGILLLGCGEESIRRYRVPKSEAEKPEAAVPVERPARRMLAAIVPAAERIWFFKVEGPAQELAAIRDPFEAFVRSVRFPDAAGREIRWTLPEGWRQAPGQGMRYATLRIPASLELSVVSLGPEAGSVLANVNRWREQLGLAPVDEDELSEMTRRLEFEGIVATLVELHSPGKAGIALPPTIGDGSRGKPPKPPLQYVTPEGWEEQAAGGGMRAAAFQVREGDQRLEVTVVPLSGQAGGLAPNVNRWREQVGLGSLDETQLRRMLRSVRVGDAEASYVDLVGPESAGRRRILGAILERAGQTWFFKMQGPADLVEKHKASFEAFLRSVRFET